MADNEALTLMSRFLPADIMGLVRRVLADVISPNKGTFLSFALRFIVTSTACAVRKPRFSGTEKGQPFEAARPPFISVQAPEWL